jgi:hypothetical protein
MGAAGGGAVDEKRFRRAGPPHGSFGAPEHGIAQSPASAGTDPAWIELPQSVRNKLRGYYKGQSILTAFLRILNTCIIRPL